jgi:MFS family permease
VGAEIQKQPSTLEREIKRQQSFDSTGLQQDGELAIEDSIIIVRKNGDYNPINPHNWSLISRAKNIAILCLLVFVQGWATAAESMGNKAASRAFGVSPVAMNLATAIYLFGVSTGSLFAGPLSETFGRNPVYLIGSFCYLCFILGCTLVKSFSRLIIYRYFIGLLASVTLSINSTSVNDQFRPVKRAFVFPVVAWANLTGNIFHFGSQTLLN